MSDGQAARERIRGLPTAPLPSNWPFTGSVWLPRHAARRRQPGRPRQGPGLVALSGHGDIVRFRHRGFIASIGLIAAIDHPSHKSPHEKPTGRGLRPRCISIFSTVRERPRGLGWERHGKMRRVSHAPPAAIGGWRMGSISETAIWRPGAEKCAIAKRRCYGSRASSGPVIGAAELYFLGKQFGKYPR